MEVVYQRPLFLSLLHFRAAATTTTIIITITIILITIIINIQNTT